MQRLIRFGMLVIVAAVSGRAFAQEADDFMRSVAPLKWVERLAPETLPELEYPSYFNDLDKAREQVFHGRYRQALLTLRTVELRQAGLPPANPTTAPATAPSTQPAYSSREEIIDIALIKSEALAAVGRDEEAIKVVADSKIADEPAVQVFHARLLAGVGKNDDAITLLRDHLRANPTSIAGHYYLGEISEQIGDIDAAKSAFTWFIEKPQNFLERWKLKERGPFESAEQTTLIGRALDHWATLTESYRNTPALDKTILNLFIRVYDVIDRQYWPAHLAAGEYFASHDQDKEAGEELEAARKANPNYARTLTVMGKMAVDHFSFDGADTATDMMRMVNIDSNDASLLDARNLLRQRRPELAEADVLKVLAVQPKNLEAMGLLAAVYALELKDAKTADVLRQVDQINSHNATAYFEVAEQLSAMRQYPRSAEMFKKAIERASWWTAARNGLGLLYTQSGDEEDARTTLNAAHELDPFNLATTNYLKLLDMMNAFAKKESAHFVVMYDEKTDPVIPEYFSDYLESVHDQICKSFEYEPKVKTYIEVFPTHEAFSVRTTGSPWIGTVGASTGRVIALVAPRGDKKTLGPFNWAQVLRHEYTHTVTLGATDNRIQHWMTEGLAVYEERTPLRWEWVPMLYNAVKKHQLFPIDQLTWSFVRPKKPSDRQLAYAESFWICQYIEETYGHDTILRMLADFRGAEPQELVFPKETKKALTDFQSEFMRWCEKKVSTWGYDEETSEKYDALKEKAQALISGRQYVEAAKVYEEMAALRPVDALPHQRLAGLYMTKEAKDVDKVVAELTRLAQVELNDNRYAKKISRVYFDEGRFEESAKYALTAVYTDPYDRSAHETLAAVYEKLGNATGLEREKRVIADIDKLEADKKDADNKPIAQ